METTSSKQEDIFSASLLLFAERGFNGTTIPMIAERANVGAGTIYRYFENKESLVNELFQKYVEEFLNCIQSGLMSERKGIREGFHHIFEGMVKFTIDYPRALGFISMHSQGTFLNEKSRATYEKLEVFVCDFFQEGQQQKIIRALSLKVLIAILFGSFMKIQELIENKQEHFTNKLIEDVEESLWAAISIKS
ncbi:TetR/AcrR family transcriptional regulator [Bacillus cereus]|uniref:TetR/AcrR family transcriptional regulator n=1 Tax=Bacillus cereus TaxID=1396 RepID=UPI00187A3991|nr:TetR/AcrR family transcriptional regulator [Bacillus cereus]MBE7106977.1 TetR/AcrR family transcriptional regulator [Bacillus cereus]